MRTEDLIRSLSGNVEPVSRHALQRRFLLGVGGGVFLASTLLAAWLGVQSSLLAPPLIGAFLTKFFYTALLAATAIAASIHLMRPEARPAKWFLLAAAPVAVLGAFALIELSGAPREAWPEMISGISIGACLIRISIISIPIFLSLVWAARSMAPTQLRITGAAIGFAAGSLGAAIYAFHCVETGASFIFLWYSAAILIVSCAGALIAPRFLRW